MSLTKLDLIEVMTPLVQGQQRQDARLDRMEATILRELKTIKSCVIIIGGKPVSDFLAMTEEQKQVIEEVAPTQEQLEEAVIVHDALMAPIVRTATTTKQQVKAARDYRDSVKRFSTGEICRTYDRNVDRGTIINIGRRIAQTVANGYSRDFAGKFPPVLHDFVLELGGYFMTDGRNYISTKKSHLR